MEGVRSLRRADDRDDDLAALFEVHYRPMCRLAFVILGDAALAEDVVMDALVKSFSGWNRLRDRSSAGTYLRRAVVNGCRSRMRRNKIESRVNATMHGRDSLRPSQWDPEARELQRVVWDAVRGLPPRQRACVVLHYLEDLPAAEIAEVLGIAVGTVKSQLAKARAKLETQLGSSLQGGAR